MSTHISNVQKRKYAELDEETRQMHPSALGLALIHSYASIDEDLVLPTVRSAIENACSDIAQGTADFETVVNYSIRTFKRKFFRFAQQIDTVPLMLAVAYFFEKGGSSIAGDAAEEGLQLWDDASAKIVGTSLEALQAQRHITSIASIAELDEEQYNLVDEMPQHEFND